MTRLEYAAYNDIIFKMMFADERNRDLLQSFLTAALDLPEGSIERLIVKNGEITPVEANGKVCRLDINLSINNMAVDVEMQVAPTRDFPNRALYYWADIFLSGGEQGVDYNKIHTAITINLMNHTMFDDDRFYREFVPADLQTGDVLSDKMHIKFFELTKVPRVAEGLAQERIKEWLQFLKCDTEEELDMLERTSPAPEIRRAAQVLSDMSSDEKVKEQVRARRMALNNWVTSMNSSREEGRLEGKAEVVDSLLQEGFTLPNALRIAGITEEAYRQAKQVTGE